MASIGQVVNKTYIPTLKWHQNNDYLFLSFEVHNSKNEDIKLYEEKVFFSVKSDNIYLMEFELNNLINVDESKYVIEEKCVRIILKKKESEKWDFLTKDRNLYKNNIKINWAEWNDDDSDNEAPNDFGNSQFDFQKMMESMGGMGDMSSMMQGMGDMSSMMDGMEGLDNEEGEDDEDDEDAEDAEDCNDIEDCCGNKDLCDKEDCNDIEDCCGNKDLCDKEDCCANEDCSSNV